MKKGPSKKNVPVFLKMCKYTFFNIWKREPAKEMFQGFLRFVSILFLIIEKEGKQKIVLCCFKICKYTFLSIWKSRQATKLGKDFFKIYKYTIFDIWKKGQPKELCQYFWRCVSILFLLFEKRDKQKKCSSISEDLTVFCF